MILSFFECTAKFSFLTSEVFSIITRDSSPIITWLSVGRRLGLTKRYDSDGELKKFSGWDCVCEDEFKGIKSIYKRIERK